MFKKMYGASTLALILAVPALAQETGAPAKAAQEAPPSLGELQTKLRSAMQSQKWETVIESSRAILAQSEKDGEAWHHLGYALHAQGKLDEALKAHLIGAELPRFGATCAYNAACVYSLQGNADAAFEWLGKAKAKGFSDAATASADPDLTNLSGDARFAEFVKGLGAAQGSAGGPRGVPQYKLYQYPTQRAGFRVLYFGNNGSPGQVAIDHGVLPWKDSFEQAIVSGKADGQRWRLGKDFWTRLDTTFDLNVGGKNVPAGAYYLTLERSADGTFKLAFNDPATIRAAKLDPSMAMATTGGIEVAVSHGDLAAKADTLTMSMKMDTSDQFAGVLSIQFGGHELTAPVNVLAGSAGS